MRYFSADKIHSGYGFLPEGSVLVMDDLGFVADIKPEDELQTEQIEKLGGILCPGFINTHCHLELSYLKNKLNRRKGLHEFIKEIESLKRPQDEEMVNAAAAAEKAMKAAGIVAVGDICNTSLTFSLKTNSSLYYHNFLEVYAFDPQRADQAFEKGKRLEEEAVKAGLNYFSIVPHAPYSASLSLLKLISNYASDLQSVLSIHMQENQDEDELFKSKSGKILERLKLFGINTDSFVPTGKSSLQSTLPHLPINCNLLLVHNTFAQVEDFKYADEFSQRIYRCVCAAANEFIEGKLPDLPYLQQNFTDSMTMGTDSLASNDYLSLAHEMNVVLKYFPELSLEQMIRWATLNGARFLKIDDRYGSFEKGKKPGLVLLNKNEDGQYFSAAVD